MNTNNPYAGNAQGQMSASVNMAGASGEGLIKDTTTAGFTRDVMDESRQQPVLVDFWAPWCGPCKQLTPVLERVVTEAAGRVKLVKMNIDDHPSIAGQLGIQSIPAVVAFVGGRPVDGFMGAVPESKIREFIDKIAGPAVDPAEEEIAAVLLEADALLEAKDAVGAAELYAAVLQVDPENAPALVGMANCMILTGQIEQARGMLVDLPEALEKDAGIIAIQKKLALIEEARKLGDPNLLEAELQADPNNHASRLKLAKIRNVEGDRDTAADHLLYIMKRDRAFEDDGARRELVGFFEVWGPMDPSTIAARRKLSSILFS